MSDALAEWLRRSPAKRVGFARVSSNLTGVVIVFLSILVLAKFLQVYVELSTPAVGGIGAIGSVRP